MKTRFAFLGILVTLALVVGGTDASAAIEVKGVGIQKTIDCAGGSVVVTGSKNELTLRGDCAKVTLSGAGHVIHVEGLGRVKVSGLNNLVEWQRALAGEAPSVEDSGMGNEVRRASGAAKTGAPAASGARSKSGSVTVDDTGVKVQTESGEVAVTASGVKARSGSSQAEVTPAGVTAESGRNRATVSASGIEAEGEEEGGDDGATVINGLGIHRTVRCGGRGITINGANHVLRLEGDCRTVTVNGMGQHVKVEAAGSIVVNGTSQRVEWVRGLKAQRPSIQKNGLGNEVLQITAEEFSKQ